MGIDAESQDLTSRIRALRERGVANGSIAPARPGEFRLGGVPAPSAQVARAHEARARRSPEVVEMQYTDEEREALALGPEDGGDALPDEAEPTAEEEMDFETAPAVVEEEFATWPEPDEQPAEPEDGADLFVSLATEEKILAAMHEEVEGLRAQIAAQTEALVALGKLVEAVAVGVSSSAPRRRWSLGFLD